MNGSDAFLVAQRNGLVALAGLGDMSEEEILGNSEARGFGGLRISVIKLGLLSICVSSCFLLLFLHAALVWWLLLILALPIELASAWLGGKVFADKYGWSTAQVGFSLKRIAFGVLLAMGLSTGVYFVWKLFN